jgi:hypothetical protein
LVFPSLFSPHFCTPHTIHTPLFSCTMWYSILCPPYAEFFPIASVKTSFYWTTTWKLQYREYCLSWRTVGGQSQLKVTGNTLCTLSFHYMFKVILSRSKISVITYSVIQFVKLYKHILYLVLCQK